MLPIYIAARHTTLYLTSGYFPAGSISEYAITRTTAKNIADSHVIFHMKRKISKYQLSNASLENAP